MAQQLVSTPPHRGVTVTALSVILAFPTYIPDACVGVGACVNIGACHRRIWLMLVLVYRCCVGMLAGFCVGVGVTALYF